MQLLPVYAVTIIVFAIPWPILWFKHSLTTMRMVALLFTLDMTLTIEAAINSDVILIALLHVITVPAFFALIYVDLVKEHKTAFRCFICGRNVDDQEDYSTVRRKINGKQKNVLVHSSCVNLAAEERKSLPESLFKDGIPK